MFISCVVVDASPLICLFKSGLAELFPAMFRDIVVPDAVIREIVAKGRADFEAQTLVSYGWIRQIADVAIDPRVASWDLGEGESAVLSFALKDPEYWTLIDDREARRCAMSLHCHYIGTLGMIVLAKKRGIITSVRKSLERLQSAGLWLSESLVNKTCQKAGEE